MKSEDASVCDTETLIWSMAAFRVTQLGGKVRASYEREGLVRGCCKKGRRRR